ncbi:MAG: hypothetical protein M1838_000397 [Thelocarpon superellum]|nr:MAG: hypothetical protein M1838_000397 [Thelocarpon superellum]
MEEGEEPEEPLTLSAGAVDALREFYAEQDVRQKEFEDLRARADQDLDQTSLTMDAFTEDWNASQFWASKTPSERPRIHLLEFDQRFEVFKEYVPYDFHHPLRLPLELKGSFDRIICDPPFLSPDCQTKAAVTVRWLSKPEPVNVPTVSSGTKRPLSINDGKDRIRVIVCTGERMGSLVQQLHGKVGMQLTTFRPHHAKGLSNEFRCYANFECQDWTWSRSDA